MTNTVLSLIRTYVPVGVGALVAWLVTLGIELSDDARNGLVVFLTGLAIAAYYTIVRLLEKRWPKIGVLLGAAKQPEYVTPPVSDKPVETPRHLQEPVRNYPQY